MCDRILDMINNSYTGCDGFARYSERVSADIAGIYRLRFPPKKQKTGTADSCYGT